jgi:formate--tetrahydrofolate ligase
VIVATVRALKMNGEVAKDALGTENLAALDAGFANLARHVRNVDKFGVPIVVGINRFVTDSDAEMAFLVNACRTRLGVEAIVCTHWAEGSAGSETLARAVVALTEAPRTRPFEVLYPDNRSLNAKIETIAREIYHAGSVVYDSRAAKRLKELEAAGHGHLPVCIAKTQSSFSADPSLIGAPSGHALPVREVRLSAGAGFVVVICGEIRTMPGLPRVPAAERIRLAANGDVEGLS